MNLINKILNIGVKESLSNYNKGQLKLLNGTIAVIFVICVLGISYGYIFRKVSTEQLIQTVFSLLFFFGMFWLNYKGRYNLSKGIFIGILFLTFLSSLFVYNYGFFALCLSNIGRFGFITILLDKRKSIYRVLALFLGVWIFSIIMQSYGYLEPYISFSDDEYKDIQFANVLFISLILFYTIHIKGLNRKYREELEVNISQIQDQNLILAQRTKEKEVLLAETHHRVKNNLQLIISLLELQNENIEGGTAKKTLNESIGRVSAMATIHQMLYENDDYSSLDISIYLRDIVNSLISFYPGNSNNIIVEFDLESIELDVDCSISLGLIVNEICTNTLKYGINKERENKINLSVKTVKDQVVLSFSDSGNGLPDQNVKKSLGFKLISLLVSQIGGEYKMISNNGFGITIKFRNR